ncbi:O-antigen ligase family protein [Citricoccus sp. NPDC055426]|uniref:O-antigen ligase family protein n=1 Tax=Citricoccus sp. NPDC055426 TaxID=3155536 RepID=UPI0034273ACD
MTRATPLMEQERSPHVLALLLALVAATSGTERGLIVPGLKLSDIVLVVLIGAIFVRWLGRWRIIDGLGLAVLGYAGVYALMTLINFAQRPELPVSELLPELLSGPQFLLLYLVAFAIGQKTDRLTVWLKPTMIIASLMGLLAVVQVLDVGPTREILSVLTGAERLLDPLEWQVYRGTGLFPSWHALGMYLAIHAVIAIVLIGRETLEPRTRRWLFVAAIMCSIGILTTTTGTPMVIVAVAILLYLLSPRNAVLVVLAGVVLTVGATATPIWENISQRIAVQFDGDSLIPSSFMYRVRIWERDFIPLIEQSPWTGHGPVLAEAGLFEYMESMYITVLVYGGIPLLLALAVLVVAAWARMRAVASTAVAPMLSGASRAMKFLMVMLAGFMVIHPYLADAGGAPMVFTALGVVSGFAYSQRATTTEAIAR